MRRWAKEHGFPVILMPGGGAMTSTGIIDLWLLSRMPQQRISQAELDHAVAELGDALQASPATLAKVQEMIDQAVQSSVRCAVEAASASGRLQQGAGLTHAAQEAGQ